MDLLDKPPVVGKKVIWKCVGIVLLLVISYVFLSLGIRDGERFLSLRDAAVKLEAQIVRVKESYDSEGDRQYDAIMRYSYDGKTYESEYRSYSTRSKAMDSIGSTVTITVDPADPETQLKDLTIACGMFCFLGAVVFGLFWRLLRMGVRKPYAEHLGWNRDTVRMDLPATIYNQHSWDCWLLPAVIGLILLIRYREGLVWVLFVLDGIFLLAGIVSLTRYRAAMKLLRDDRFVLRRDAYVSKRYVYDSDGPDSYYVTFTNGENTWEEDMGKKYYESVKEGSVIETVYLEGDKKPVMKHVNS